MNGHWPRRLNRKIKDSYIEKDKTLDNLAGALQQLNKEQQLCVTLFYLEKKVTRRYRRQTDFSIMQVKSHIQNGKRNLKISWNDGKQYSIYEIMR